MWTIGCFIFSVPIVLSSRHQILKIYVSYLGHWVQRHCCSKDSGHVVSYRTFSISSFPLWFCQVKSTQPPLLCSAYGISVLHPVRFRPSPSWVPSLFSPTHSVLFCQGKTHKKQNTPSASLWIFRIIRFMVWMSEILAEFSWRPNYTLKWIKVALTKDI